MGKFSDGVSESGWLEVTRSARKAYAAQSWHGQSDWENMHIQVRQLWGRTTPLGH
jgi:hypothetical protein